MVHTDIAGTLIHVAEHGKFVKDSPGFAGCDVIAMATHGYGGFQRWTLGSITERVLHATRLPLLIVRPPDLLDKRHQTQDEAAMTALEQ